MKVEPGNLCFFVDAGSTHPYEAATLTAARDRIVRVLDRDCDGLWIFEQALKVTFTMPGAVVTAWITAAIDECLRPIDPGEGEDEVIRRVGKPAALPKPVTAHPRSTEFARSQFTQARDARPLLALSSYPHQSRISERRVGA